ncbi:ABC transporter ATP-binding protein [Bradyrhizobium sp. 23]|uniref:ABC transporter ATP-binding protein n=1 Tax=Bradyrhizobium sp. 23 TaxID=2782667 RepID=UPI001FF9ED5A|nr:ABC transporter ATP-binding protein [Bradyrhizobium sp. 23]MCK1315463.1 ABC transporter ATP-binding protein [Bradyrhizobium sp. 23]
MMSLELHSISKKFGDFTVIRELNLSIPAGQRHAIIGPNGAGKTTLFNLITGWDVPTSGSILINGKAPSAQRPDKITRSGLARSFQKNTLFENLTVFENLRIAAQAFHSSRWSILRSPRCHPDVIQCAEAAGLQMKLGDVFGRSVKALSYGRKRQLEVALALCAKPTILLMDEPAAGTSPAERTYLIDLLQGLPSSLTMVLVEHDMDVVFAVSEIVTVLSYGKVLATGSPAAVKNDPSVIAAYLGGRGHA